MICKVIETIEKNNLLSDVKSVAVGVSGGADSMCLLHILSSLKVKYGIIIKAVHLNHNLRGDEALRDENFVKEYCAENGIELLCFSEDISSLSAEMGIGEEECGRIVRYRCFDKAGCDVVAVAHSLSDSIETTLYNLLRGTGTKGLCGIPVKRNPNIIRPLIECSRQEIESYCRENNVPYITDSTNLTDDYKRNFIRHNIIPLLKEVNSAYDKNISHTASILKEESSFIELCALDLIEKSAYDNGYRLKEFIDSHIAVRKRAIGIILSEKMNKPTEFRHIESVNNIIDNKKGKVEIAKDLYVFVENDIVAFINKPDKIDYWETAFENNVAKSQYGAYRISDVEFPARDCDTFDAEKIEGMLMLTSRKQGDIFISKSRGVSKTLKKLFNEMKIPAGERESKAVLRDSKGIIWVEGVGVNAPYLPDKDTKNFFVIKKEG